MFCLKAEADQGTAGKSAGVEDREGNARDADSLDQLQAEGEKRNAEEKLPELPPRAARPSSLTRSFSSTFTSDPAVRLEVATLRAHNDELLKQTSEVSALKAHNDNLRGRSSALEAELAQMSQQLEEEQRNKAELTQQVMSLQRRLEKLQSQQANADVLVSPSHSPAKLMSTPPPTSDV